MSIRVIVADDQSMVRAGFAALINAEDDLVVVGQAVNGAECIELSHTLNPDVILMDVRMPVMDGIEATRQLLSDQASGTPPRVVMLTTFDIDDYVFEALRAGASGFLLKDALPAELIHAIHVIAAGEALLAPSVTRRVIERFVSTPNVGRRIEPLIDVLTSREREVLILVARGCSNHEIADLLFIAEQTVKTHVSRILTKLQARDRAQAVIAAYESGLVSAEAPTPYPGMGSNLAPGRDAPN